MRVDCGNSVQTTEYMQCCHKLYLKQDLLQWRRDDAIYYKTYTSVIVDLIFHILFTIWRYIHNSEVQKMIFFLNQLCAFYLHSLMSTQFRQLTSQTGQFQVTPTCCHIICFFIFSSNQNKLPQFRITILIFPKSNLNPSVFFSNFLYIGIKSNHYFQFK